MGGLLAAGGLNKSGTPYKAILISHMALKRRQKPAQTLPANLACLTLPCVYLTLLGAISRIQACLTMPSHASSKKPEVVEHPGPIGNRDGSAVEFAAAALFWVLALGKSTRFRRLVEGTRSMKRSKSPPVTPEMAAHIRFLIRERKLFQHQAAALVGVNQGRVSEVMNDLRHPGVPPTQGSFPF